MSDNFEQEFWGDCCNTYDEEQKHFVYADVMKLKQERYSFKTEASTIIDVGGGPVSILLKTIGYKVGVVIDPLMIPLWAKDRYDTKSIVYAHMKAETYIQIAIEQSHPQADEVWIYNVLQHTDDPVFILKHLHLLGKVIRIFDWVNIPPHEGHPHMITEPMILDNIKAVLSQTCRVELFQNGCFGTGFGGVFKVA